MRCARACVLLAACFSLLPFLSGNASAGSPGEWAAGFGPCGISGELVRDLAVYDGELVAAGIFASGGGVLAPNIASWDGEAWHPLGTGFNPDHVISVGVWNGKLLAAGTSFDPAYAHRVFAWDGETWSAIADPVEGGIVWSMIPFRGELIAAGSFTSIGGVPATSIARYDGSAWHALGSGTNGTVLALATHDTRLVAAGSFTTAGGAPVGNIAAWDGTNWSGLASGADSTVYSLALFDGDLAAAGAFHTAGGVVADRVALWTGTAWTALGTFPGSERVYAIASVGASLYTGSNHAYRWTGSNWMQLGTGFGGGPRYDARGAWTLAAFEGEIYAAGDFGIADGKSAPHVARWEGTTWGAVPTGEGLSGAVEDLAVHQGGIVAIGFIYAAGTTLVDQAVRWTGSMWEPLGSGFFSGKFNPPPVVATPYQTDVVVGGLFWDAGGVEAQSIARWDGTSWHPLGSLERGRLGRIELERVGSGSR